MTAPAAPDLERLAGVAALERPAQAKRMLVIVNPYATTMSDRLKHLVVYALQGRYDVTAVDTQRKGHAIELCREAAREGYDVVVAFGGDGTVNEAANGLAGTETPLTCLPGGANNVFGKMLGIPNDVVDATEHLLALRTAGSRAPSTSAASTAARSPSPPAWGSTRASSSASTRTRHMKRRFGHWYFTQKAVGTFLRKYVVHPPKLSASVDGGEPIDGVSVFFQNGQPLHVLQGAARQPHRGRSAGLGRPRRRGAHAGEPGRRPDRHLPRALDRGDPRPPPRGGVRGRARGDHPLPRRPARAVAGRRRPRRRRRRGAGHGRAREHCKSWPEYPARAARPASRLDKSPTPADVQGWAGE